MTTRYRTRAFVFKKNDRNESDRVFSVFTNDFGRLDIFAKAVRKGVSKLRGGIDIFFISDIEFIQGKVRKTLTDAIAVEKFSNVSRDLEKFNTANKIGEVLDSFIKGEEKDKEIFDLLSEIMDKLNNKEPAVVSQLVIYYYFLWNVLSILGYRPEVQKCNVCQEKLNPYNVYFSGKIGGVICEKCLHCDAQCQKINSDIVKILRLFFKKEWQVISKLKIESSSQKLFKKVSDDYYSYILSSHSSRNISKIGLEVI